MTAFRINCLVVLAAIFAASLWTAPAADLVVPAPTGREILRIGFTESSFRNMNRDDALAAFRVFIQITGTRRGYTLETQVNVYADAAALRQAAATGMMEVAWMDAWDCALPMTGERLQPAFYTSWGRDRVDRQYLLLVRTNSGVGCVSELRGRVVMESPAIATDMARHWVASLLLTNGLGSPERFFERIETVEKPSAAVFPVFFGKRDACVVDEAAFGLLNEMNPQIGRVLRPLASSVPLPSSIICLATNGWSSGKLQADVHDAMRDLHLEPDGRQILTLFKGSRLLPYEEGAMVPVRALRALLDVQAAREGT